MNNYVSIARDALHDKNSLIIDQRSQIFQKDFMIINLLLEHNEQESIITNQRGEINEKNRIIVEQQNQLAEFRKETLVSNQVKTNGKLENKIGEQIADIEIKPETNDTETSYSTMVTVEADKNTLKSQDKPPSGIKKTFRTLKNFFS
jgi:hypothetical protein